MLVQQDNLKNSFAKSFDGAVNSFELLNDSYYHQYENSMAYIIKDSTNASILLRNKIRYKLREKFTTLYADRKLAGLSTFQIFDSRGISIIRFHELNKYDDEIINKRDSLKHISKTFLAQKGFEIGKYYFAYRFQYPLFYDGNFVGSYEFGIEFSAIDKEMKKLFGIENVFLLEQNIVTKVCSNKEISEKYKIFKFKNHIFYEPSDEENSDIYISFKEKLYKDNVDLSSKKTTFVNFYYNGLDYLALFTPVNNIDNKHIGFILTFVKDNISSIIFRTFREELFIAILFGLLVLFWIYKEIEYRKYIRNIIDTQNDILIVTDGKKIKDVNQAFLDFFDVKDIDEFRKQVKDCVCDYFLEEEGYIQKLMGDKSWIDYINSMKNQEHIAILKDKKNEKKYFKIEVNGFSKSKDFIVVFYDITNDLQIKQELENKAYYDQLTRIYSRERFDHYLNQMLIQKREFSLIMFDIDHFKIINDDYGHDVGDSVLKELTELVSEHIRENDIFARWGGEEFMIIVNIDIVKAEKFANKLRQVIEEHKFKHINDLTCSFGVAGYRGFDKFETIVKRVDNMLYSAKNSGRNCVVIVN